MNTYHLVAFCLIALTCGLTTAKSMETTNNDLSTRIASALKKTETFHDFCKDVLSEIFQNKTPRDVAEEMLELACDVMPYRVLEILCNKISKEIVKSIPSDREINTDLLCPDF